MITNTANRNDRVRGHGFDQFAFEKSNHLRVSVGGAWTRRKLLLTALLPWLARADDAPLPAPETWRVSIEGRLFSPPVSQPIENAEKSLLAAQIADGPVWRSLTARELERLGMTWEQFANRAAENAGTRLPLVVPKYIRGRKGVIVSAEIRTREPLAAAIVLAPGFLKMFSETLGEKVQLVVPNRYTAFVFPGLASSHADFSQTVREAYRATAYPVSMELFELSRAGLRAVGVFE